MTSIFAPVPWPQLQRYHEHACWWNADLDPQYQWANIAQLTNVVDLRASFDQPFNDCVAIRMPHLRFATFGVTMDIEKIINCFDLPSLEGLNLLITNNDSPDTLGPLPTQLKDLKILWLSMLSGLSIPNTSLFCFLTGIPTLTDLAIELRGIESATYLFTLLSPAHFMVVPRLQVLRIGGESEVTGESLDALLVMLRQRFGGVDGADCARLQHFKFFLHRLRFRKASPMISSLEELRVQHGWDVRVHENWFQGFWNQEMDRGFF
ncbi:hypothetical protein MVEN_02017900 [Mycena venus]|uniref:Uncharacterized protein n=1 Tax=Mycena venus TaxID=2733690 RepID=A0A8H7CHU3_9AGAR|nr:hypothetical protein MVEN_02017900 [Mycena venus]